MPIIQTSLHHPPPEITMNIRRIERLSALLGAAVLTLSMLFGIDGLATNENLADEWAGRIAASSQA
jgi:hypothetical protein